jgi:hypothetical protein
MEVQYNVYGRDIDKIAIVMYASDATNANDGEGNWHILAGDANADGTLKNDAATVINDGNSFYRATPVSRLLTPSFPKTGGDPEKMIDKIQVVVYPLKMEKTSVPLVPTAGFGL